MNPFETTEDGFYRVIQPAEGMEPDELAVRLGDRTFRLSDYAGKDVESRIHPDVLVYRECEVISGE